jgi:hypothetical protein
MSKIPTFYPKRKEEAPTQKAFQAKAFVRVSFYTSISNLVLRFGEEIVQRKDTSERHRSVVADTYDLALVDLLEDEIIVQETVDLQAKHYYTFLVFNDQILSFPETEEEVECPVQGYNRIFVHNISTSSILLTNEEAKLRETLAPTEVLEFEMQDGFYTLHLEEEHSKTTKVYLDLMGSDLIHILHFGDHQDPIVLQNPYCLPDV